MGNHLKESPLHLSGHSGGGKYVAGALEKGIKTSKVSVFDGIYSDTTKSTLVDWHKKTGGALMTVTVKGMSPETYSATMRTELGIRKEEQPIIETISGVQYQVYKKGSFNHYSRYAGPVSSLQAHFDVVTNTWPLTIQPR